MSQTEYHGLLDHSEARPIALPAAQPLTLTRNFYWVVGLCGLILLTAPLAIGWSAAALLQ